MDRPERIEKRVYSCKSCEYTAQVYGETYFDSGCHNYMATFECPECKVLFEGLITLIILDKMDSDAYHDLAEDFECLRCGNKNAKVWNKSLGRCPKCHEEMSYEVTGTIRVKF
jgi:hypothetical protein